MEKRVIMTQDHEARHEWALDSSRMQSRHRLDINDANERSVGHEPLERDMSRDQHRTRVRRIRIQIVAHFFLVAQIRKVFFESTKSLSARPLIDARSRCASSRETMRHRSTANSFAIIDP